MRFSFFKLGVGANYRAESDSEGRAPSPGRFSSALPLQDQATRPGWAPFRSASVGLLLLLGAASADASTLITNVATVNVTPSGFSVVWVTSPAPSPSQTATISVYADPFGATDLAGQLGVEWYPLNSGSPAATNAYQQRLSQALLRQQSQNLGFTEVRISGCAPRTTYYYRIGISDTNGTVATWPAAGPLPSVTTAQANSFVADSVQLLINVSPIAPPGTIILLSNTNTPSLLAAVVGDGGDTNQVYFSLSDLVSAGGTTNFTPVGPQEFTAAILGNTSGSASRTYDLSFTSSFNVGVENQFTLGAYLSLAVGLATVQAGHSGSLPIQLLYGSGITNLTLYLQLPTGDFSSLSVQLVSSQLNSASLHLVNSGLVAINLGSGYGQALQGAQELAQLNFTIVTNQASGYVSVTPLVQQAVNSDGTFTTNFVTQAGQVLIIGRQPVLQPLPTTSAGVRSLVLYGNPGSNYELQASTNVHSPAAWQNVLSVPMTNLSQVITGLDTNHPAVFYRAY